jgi:plastocyanin
MRAYLTAGIALLLASCSSMDNNGPQTPSHDITIKKNASTLGATAFSPVNLTFSLAQKTKVTWYNGDITGSGSYGGSTGTSHRLISDDGATFHSSTLAPGDIFSPIFHIPGTFTYHCEIHPTMTGTVTVNP